MFEDDIVVSLIKKCLLDEGVVGFEYSLGGLLIEFNEGVESFKYFWRVRFSFLQVVDDFDNIDGQKLRHFLYFGVVQYFMAKLKGNVDDLQVD